MSVKYTFQELIDTMTDEEVLLYDKLKTYIRKNKETVFVLPMEINNYPLSEKELYERKSKVKVVNILKTEMNKYCFKRVDLENDIFTFEINKESGCY